MDTTTTTSAVDSTAVDEASLPVVKKRKRPSAALMKNISRENQKFLDSIEDDALAIIDTVFPKKIKVLDELFAEFNEKRVTFEFTLSEDGEVVDSNNDVLCVYNMLRSEILELVTYLGTLKLWLKLLVPKIEDGNNFGVGIQQEILMMLGTGRMSAFEVLKLMSNYFLNRGSLVVKAGFSNVTLIRFFTSLFAYE